MKNTTILNFLDFLLKKTSGYRKELISIMVTAFKYDTSFAKLKLDFDELEKKKLLEPESPSPRSDAAELEHRQRITHYPPPLQIRENYGQYAPTVLPQGNNSDTNLFSNLLLRWKTKLFVQLWLQEKSVYFYSTWNNACMLYKRCKMLGR